MNKIEQLGKAQRRYFDPSKKEDMKAIKIYFKDNKWGKEGCPFYLQWPYMTIPDMMKDLITRYILR